MYDKSGKQDTGSVVYERKEWTDDDRSHRTGNAIRDPAVSSYVTNHPLEQDKIEPEQGVRKQYYETQWTTDFVVMFADGTMGVRELITKNKLSQRSEIEKLQLSQSYWQKITAGWKIVITQ